MTTGKDDELQALMRLAFEGDRDAAQKFFELLVNTELIVPNRKQSHPLSDSPEYPNDLIDILGVQSNERVFVPIFSVSSLVVEWCGTELKTRTIKIKELLDIIPEEWWLILNPGQDIEKEFSPWELAQLKGAGEGVTALLQDFDQVGDERTAQVYQLTKDEYLPLKNALTEFGKEHPEIDSIYALREERKDGNDPESESISVVLIAFEGSMSAEISACYQSELSALASRAMIGEIGVKVVPSTSAGNAFLHGVFRHYEPVYQSKRPKSKILRMFQKWLTRP